MNKLYPKNQKKSTMLFRCDSSSKIGLGHVMRDLVYAKEYHKKDEVHFACQDLQGNINHNIPHPLHILTSNEPEELIKLIKSLKADTLIIDHYGIDYKAEKKIKETTDIKFISFDDDYREHFCDKIVNHNLSADIHRYKNPDIVSIIPPLIRDEFKKEKNIKREKIYDIFIAMGGADTTNINIPILKTLSNSLHVAVATTNTNANLDELKKFVTCRANMTLHVDSKNIARLLNQSKLAIITPSVMVQEVLFMEVDFVAIKTACNQDDMYKYLKKNSYSTLERWNEAEFKKWYNRVMQEVS